MGAYKLKSPQRGDLVLLEHKSSPALFIKRVVGISGDIVETGLTEPFLSMESRSFVLKYAVAPSSKRAILPTTLCSNPQESQKASSSWSVTIWGIVSTAASPNLAQLSRIRCVANRSSSSVQRSPEPIRDLWDLTS